MKTTIDKIIILDSLEWALNEIKASNDDYWLLDEWLHCAEILKINGRPELYESEEENE